jgi:hypothetical protein
VAEPSLITGSGTFRAIRGPFSTCRREDLKSSTLSPLTRPNTVSSQVNGLLISGLLRLVLAFSVSGFPHGIPDDLALERLPMILEIDHW